MQVCVGCGNGFEGRKRKYCDVECWKKNYWGSRRKNPVPTHCKVCGVGIQQSVGTGGRPRQTCSGSCRAKGWNAPLDCDRCGKNVLRSHKVIPKGAFFCGKKCRKQQKRINSVRPCTVCFGLFISNPTGRRGARPRVACSDECRHALRQLHKKLQLFKGECEQCGVHYEILRERGYNGTCSFRCSRRRTWSKKNHRRRALVKNAFVDGDITVQGVIDRDGNGCSLCGLTVDLNASELKLKPSIDHVIALANGGEHSWGNVQLAHFGCNARKGTRQTHLL